MTDLLLDDINDVPRALRNGLAAARDVILVPAGSQPIHITGSGDSLFAARALVGPLNAHGVQLAPQFPLSLARQRQLSPKEVLVAASFSGTATRTVEAAAAAVGLGARVVAVTADVDSALADTATDVVPIDWDTHSRSLPHCADHVATMVALLAAVEGLTDTRLELPILDRIDRRLAHARNVGARLARRLASAAWIYLVAPGDSLPIAEYGAAKLWELSGQHAVPFELEEFGHGPHMMLGSDDALVFVASDDGVEDIMKGAADWGREVGADVIALKPSPFDGVSRLFDDQLALQWLTYWLQHERGITDVSRGDRLQTPSKAPSPPS